MANSKIAALTASTTPLAGTEVLPIVQSSTTKKVAVSDLTAGRAVSMLSANISSGAVFSNTRLSVGNNTSTPVAWGIVTTENCGTINPPTNVGLNIGWNWSNGDGETDLFYGISAGGAPKLRIASWNGTSVVNTLECMSNNEVKVSSQNLVFGTANKGINFSGNGNVLWRCGAGTPEGAVTAPVGSLYTRTDGGAGTTLYIKESGTGNTGWVGK